MYVDDAVRAAEFVQCNEIFGVHYDTFPEIVINHFIAEEKFRQKGKKLHLLQIGEVRDL
jgi:L-ascorbate metabolism protein UlaG (beta-lactamase superfamily)